MEQFLKNIYIIYKLKIMLKRKKMFNLFMFVIFYYYVSTYIKKKNMIIRGTEGR